MANFHQLWDAAKMQKAWERCIRFIAWISGGLLCLAMLFMVGDGLGRYALSYSIPGLVEIVERYVIVVVVFLAWPFTQAAGIHIRTSLLVSRLSPKLREMASIFVAFVGFVLFAVLCWQNGNNAIFAFAEGSVYPAGRYFLPVCPLAVLVTVSCVLVSVVFLNSVITKIMCFPGKGN